MAKALKIAAIVVGVIALTVATAGLAAPAATAAFLGSIATGLTVSTALTALGIASSLLGLAAGVMAKKPKLGSALSGQQLEWRADPAAGEPYVLGKAMVGASVVHQRTWGDKNKFLGIVGVLSVCTIQAFDGFYADMTQISFSGRNATGYYANYLYVSTQLGAMPEASALNMTAPDASQMPDWGSAYKTSGLATCGMVLVADIDNGKVYSGGTPKFTNLLEGVKAYDSRADSTQAGGSGTQRALDETTYVYSDNPWVHAETYALGRWQNGKIVIGPGMPADQIDFASYMEAANVADANGWKISGLIYSTDAKWQALKAMAQAGGGWPMPTGAHLAALVNAPKVSIAIVTEADAKGPVEAPQMSIRRDRLNGAIPRYRSAAHGWEIVPGDAVRNATYLAADGGRERTREVELPLVADNGNGAGKTQAAQLAAYEVANTRERGPISVELGYEWSQLKLGDCVTLEFPSARLNSQKAIVIGRAINVSKNTITLTFRTETDAKHAWALGVAGTVSTPPTVVQPPGAGDVVTASQDIRNSYFKGHAAAATDAGSSATITISNASGATLQIDYATDPPQDVAVSGGSVTGLAYSTEYFVYADVDAMLDTTPTYGATTVYGDAVNSASHPNRIYLNIAVTTPAAGGGGTTGSGTSGGYGGSPRTSGNPLP